LINTIQQNTKQPKPQYLVLMRVYFTFEA